MRIATASRRNLSALTCGKCLALAALFSVGLAGCSPPKIEDDAEPEAKPNVMEAEFQKQLKPSVQMSPQNAVADTAPSQWNPTVIFPMPIRPWLPPADTLEIARTFPGDLRITTSAPSLLPDTPLHSPNVDYPARLTLPAPALAQTAAPDPTVVTVWISTSAAPEMRGRPPTWDRPQIATDPTAEITRALPLDPSTGLHETPLPFVRVAIPNPSGQTNIAGLLTPPPEIDSPVASFTRPAIPPLEVAPPK